jgi:hypothetical protein
MIRLLAMVTSVVCTSALAEAPHFSNGGFNLQLQYGPGFWTVDRDRLVTEVGVTNAELYAAVLKNSHTVSISAFYTILGHASIGADLTATGWNLADPTRGGGGFAMGKVAWHPLELVFMKKERRPIPLDFSTFFGIGYGITGGASNIEGQPRGMDGLLFEWGANADYFFARYFGLGLFARGVFLNWDKYYLDYNNRSQPGATLTLSKPSGGSFWTIGVSLTLRAGE